MKKKSKSFVVLFQEEAAHYAKLARLARKKKAPIWQINDYQIWSAQAAAFARIELDILDCISSQ